MNEMKPIQTCYDGYRFRSRLEARWAVFFNAAGIPYVYEPEGFKLSNGAYYLPDFYLPWFKLYIDIKPDFESESAYKEIKEKLECLYYDGYEKEIVTGLFIGDPLTNKMSVFITDATDGSAGEGWWNASFVEGAWYRREDENNTDYGYTKHWITINLGEPTDTRWRVFCRDNYECSGQCLSQRSDFAEAKTKARQARFEHNEFPMSGEDMGYIRKLDQTFGPDNVNIVGRS